MNRTARDIARAELYRVGRKLFFYGARFQNGAERLLLPATPGVANDYGFFEASARGFSLERAELTCSVVVPVYNRRALLEKTLAGLEQQTYPRELFEVILADDGSADHPEALVAEFSGRLRLRVVRQEDLGYRLAAVRNLAIQAATGEVIVSLDCDMLPEPDFLQAHLGWFHATEKSLMVIGYRKFVDTDGLSAEAILADFSVVRRLRQVAAPAAVRRRFRGSRDWRLGDFEGTRMLKNHPAPYRLASGGNVAFRRADALAAGLYFEGFDRWGGEDKDFAYRLYRRGAYFVPEPRALAYHQDHPAPVDRVEDRKATNEILGRRVPYYRELVSAGRYEIPKVSVYIPAYNGALFIERAVKSALTQSYDDFEICICDDGSTDGTSELVERLFGADRRVRLVTRPHAGIGGSSNAALALCRGEYVVQLDADDELLPGALETLAECLDGDPRLALVYGGHEVVDAEGETVRLAHPQPYDLLRHLVGNIVSHPRMFRARDFHRTGGFDETLLNAVDYDMSLKLSERGRLRYVDRILYRYHQHGNNTSVVSNAEQQLNHVRVVRAALARRGLDWEIEQLDPEQPRQIRLKIPARSYGEQLRRVIRRT